MTTPLSAAVKQVLDQQPSGVLATQGPEHPYTSLVSLAVTPDYWRLLFPTLRATQKYANLQRQAQVAILLDDRAHTPSDLEQACALTALGRAIEVDAQSRESWLELFLSRHPGLRGFVADPGTALLEVEITKYIFVSHFQEVNEYFPA